MNRAQVRGSHRLIRPSCYFHRDLQLNFSRYPDGIVVDPSPIIVLLCLSERILWVQQEWKPLQIIYWLSIRHQFPVIIYSGGHLIEPSYDPHQEPHSHQRRSIGNDSRLISRRYSNECSGRMRNDSQLHTQCWMAISNYQFPIISQSGGVLLWIKPSYDPHKKPYSDQYWLIRDDSSPLFFIFLLLFLLLLLLLLLPTWRNWNSSGDSPEALESAPFLPTSHRPLGCFRGCSWFSPPSPSPMRWGISGWWAAPPCVLVPGIGRNAAVASHCHLWSIESNSSRRRCTEIEWRRWLLLLLRPYVSLSIFIECSSRVPVGFQLGSSRVPGCRTFQGPGTFPDGAAPAPPPPLMEPGSPLTFCWSHPPEGGMLPFWGAWRMPALVGPGANCPSNGTDMQMSAPLASFA